VIEHHTTHAADALGLLITYFQDEGKTKLHALLGSYIQQIQLIEDASFELLLGRRVDNAAGELLDFLGRLVGIERLGYADATYRLLVRARIRINLTSTTGDELLAIVRFAAQSTNVVLREYYPASFVIELQGELLEDLGIVAYLISLSRAAGVGGQTIYSMASIDETFAFATGATPETEANGWADAAQASGGKLAGVVIT